MEIELMTDEEIDLVSDDEMYEYSVVDDKEWNETKTITIVTQNQYQCLSLQWKLR